MRLDFELITVAAPLQAAKFDFLFRALQVKNYSSSVRYISSIQSMICICQAVMQQYIFLCKWRGIRNPQDFQLNIVWLFKVYHHCYIEINFNSKHHSTKTTVVKIWKGNTYDKLNWTATQPSCLPQVTQCFCHLEVGS